MSRTYAHIPLWVAARRHGVVEHDHRYGECDFVDCGSKPVNLMHQRADCNKWVEKETVCIHRKQDKRRKARIGGSGDYRYVEGYETYYQVGDHKCHEYANGDRHTIVEHVYDNSRECVCDEYYGSRKLFHMCEYDYPIERYLWNCDGWGSSDSKNKKFRKTVFRASRHATRNGLNNIRDNWNSAHIGDDDDERWDDDYNYSSDSIIYSYFYW